MIRPPNEGVEICLPIVPVDFRRDEQLKWQTSPGVTYLHVVAPPHFMFQRPSSRRQYIRRTIITKRQMAIPAFEIRVA